MSMCQSVNLSQLKPIDWEVTKPVNYRDRTLHYLPTNENELQQKMNEIHDFCNLQHFKINERSHEF